MKASELIEKLKELVEEHGDLDVEYTYNDEGYVLSGSTYVDDVVVEESSFIDPLDPQDRRVKTIKFFKIY